MKNLVLSHSSDFDGIASAAMLSIKYRLPTANIFFADYHDEDLNFGLGSVENAAKTDDNVFITDINPDRTTLKTWRQCLSKLKEKGCKIFWLDHHLWADGAESIAGMAEVSVFGESKMCSTEIVKDVLKVQGAYAQRLAEMTHVSDFALDTNKKDAALLRSYDLAIVYFGLLSQKKKTQGLRRLAKELSSGRLRNKFVLATARKLEKRSGKNTEKMLAHLTLIKDKIAVGFSGNWIYSDEAMKKMFEVSGKKIVMHVICDRHKASLRSKGEDISGIARAMGGGGHPQAAGFQIGKVYDLESRAGREKFLKKIEKEATRLGVLRR